MLFVLALVFSFAQAALPAQQTTAERTNYAETSTHADVLGFVDSLQRLGAGIRVGRLGLSPMDQVLLYKLICRQVAARFDMTASFLPKPVTGVNGSGMHTNLSVSQKGKNLFWDPKGADKLSKMGWKFIDRILTSGQDICLLFNPSVNAYRRLDPHFEAPNQIKASAVDRGSMIRIPIGNDKSARIEVRSIAPDANPYIAIYTMFRTGFEGPIESSNGEKRRDRTKFLPDNIYDGIRLFKGSKFAADLLGETVHKRYADLKLASADRCPKALGALIKIPEIQFHHEVTNQYLWSKF